MQTKITAHLAFCVLLMLVAGALVGCKKNSTPAPAPAAPLKNYTSPENTDSTDIYMSQMAREWNLSGFEIDSTPGIYSLAWSDTNYAVIENMRIGIFDTVAIYVYVTNNTTNVYDNALNKSLIRRDSIAHTLVFLSGTELPFLVQDSFTYNYALKTLNVEIYSTQAGINHVHLHSN